ncbi:hypothetical protein [Paenibacillus xylanexedens]|uniref:hypothetical protein n=1 Tax=Paenibacillus xylanexedens TaxID=528191 RepID=UPI0011A6C5B7|nr:hypothetical protein [Paenibacillus xylanexedens]
MSWLNEKIAQQWRQEGRRYALHVNEFVRKSIAGETPDESELENDGRASFSAEVWEMVKQANAQEDVLRLRAELPPASWPMSEQFQSVMQAVQVVGFIAQDVVVFNISGHTQDGAVYTADSQGVIASAHYHFAGCSPDGVDYALADETVIRIIRRPDRHLEGQELAMYHWEDIQSSLHNTLPQIESLADCEYPERSLIELIPFNDGQSLLILSTYGVHLVEQSQVSLLHPDPSEIQEYELEDTQIDMGHAAVSRDGRWIAFGSQVSNHMLLDRTQDHTYSLYPEISYPHHAIFTQDNRTVWFNACHFYNGVTFQVKLDEVEVNEKKEDWPIMDENARVYASAETKQGIVIGDAYGYLRCVGTQGQEVWRHFVGGTISSIVVSPDQSKLAVGTYSGMLHILDLTSEVMDDYGIGTGTIRECERYVLWRGENPMRW